LFPLNRALHFGPAHQFVRIPDRRNHRPVFARGPLLNKLWKIFFNGCQS
jgi:hypothetical protein